LRGEELVEDIGEWGSEDVAAYMGRRNREVEGLHNEKIQDLSCAPVKKEFFLS
jgi:hypothetical protein